MSSIPVHVVHLIIVFLSLSGLWYFLDGFFLTRRELGVIANAKPVCIYILSNFQCHEMKHCSTGI